MFWFFTYQPAAMASVAFCNASIALWDVALKYEIGPANISALTLVQPLTPQSNFSSLAGNVSALGGRAFNGLSVDLSEVQTAEQTAAANVAALPQALTAAMFQSAVNSAQGVTAVFQNDGFVPMADTVYVSSCVFMVAINLLTDE
jgi:hypothetical protein